MNNILKQLQDTYSILSTIPVTGEFVESMTVVRINLRNVFQQLQDQGKDVKRDGG